MRSALLWQGFEAHLSLKDVASFCFSNGTNMMNLFDVSRYNGGRSQVPLRCTFLGFGALGLG